MREARKYVAEFIGTFALVFAGTGAIIINEVTGGAVTSVGVGLTFGMIVLTMIYAVGDVSGAHLNPAVTLGFFAARRLEGKVICPMWLASSQARWLRVCFCAGYSRSIRPSEQLLPPVRHCNR